MRTIAALAVSALTLCSGCGSTVAELPVRTEHVAGTDFRGWKTFRFAQEQIDRHAGQFPRFEQMTKNALQRELESRGYQRLEIGSPDFRVAFELSFRGQKVPHVGPEGSHAEPAAREYSDVRSSGTLTVSMLDPVTSETLWTGRIGDIQLRSVETAREIDRIAWRILAEFPPLGD